MTKKEENMLGDIDGLLEDTRDGLYDGYDEACVECSASEAKLPKKAIRAALKKTRKAIEKLQALLA